MVSSDTDIKNQNYNETCLEKFPLSILWGPLWFFHLKKKKKPYCAVNYHLSIMHNVLPSLVQLKCHFLNSSSNSCLDSSLLFWNASTISCNFHHIR